MRFLPVVAALGTVVSATEPNNRDTRRPMRYMAPTRYLERDVVILGGGAAGTYTAVRLQDVNKSVALVERNNRLGGHVNTYQVPGTGHASDYGVVVFGDTPVVHDFFNRFDIPLGTIPSNAPIGVTEYADFESGTPLKISAMGKLPISPNDTAAAFFAYGSVVNRYPYLFEGSGFKDIPDPVPEELLMSWGDFIEKYNLSAIAYPVWEYNQGVGNIMELPMLYQFKYFNQELFRITIDGLFQINKLYNNQLLYDRAAARLGCSVLLGQNVTRVARADDGVRVYTSGPDGNKMIKASQLIIATPPLLANLEPFLDLHDEESILFGQFFNSYYWNGIVANSGIPDDVTINNLDPKSPHAVPPKPGLYATEATGFPNLQRVHYSTNTPISDAEVQADILSTLETLVKAFGFKATNASAHFVAFDSHNPFELRVSTDAIKEGFYRKLEGLQGKRRTWFTGAAWEAPNSAAIWNYTENLILPRVVAALG